MRVKLLGDVYEGRTYDAFGKVAAAGRIKTVLRKERLARGEDGKPVVVRPETVIEFREGTEIDMSDASAQKFIDAKLAAPV